MGFLKFFDMVPGWVWAIALGLAMLTAFGERESKLTEQNAHNQTKAEAAQYKASVERRENERAQEALVATENQRELETIRRRAEREAQNVLLAENARTAAAVAVAAERRRVSDSAIDNFAAPSPSGGAGGGDSAAVGRAEEKALTLGRLLKTCRGEGDSDAGELEGLASQVRGLITQYEGLLLKPAGPPPTAAQRVD